MRKLTTIDLDDLDKVTGGANSFAPYGGYDAWNRSRRAEDYRHFMQLRSEGKVQFGRNREWGSAYANYMNNLTAGSRNPLNVPARGSREDNMPQ